MATLKKYNLKGKELGDVEVSDAFLTAEANGQMVKDYIVALRNNARQWSANTKTRSEVSHSTKKPHPQKGGGRARQGSLVSPQYKGGGRVFGPKPKFDQHVKINKKERKSAIRFLLGEKLRDNRVLVIENSELEAPKTKKVALFLQAAKLDRRVLFIGEGEYIDFEIGDFKERFSATCTKHKQLILSLRNIPKVQFALASNISGYDVLVAHDLVVTEAALKELEQWLL